MLRQCVLRSESLVVRNSEMIIEATGMCGNCIGLGQSLHPSQHGHHCGSIVPRALQCGIVTEHHMQRRTVTSGPSELLVYPQPKSHRPLRCPVQSLRLMGDSSHAFTSTDPAISHPQHADEETAETFALLALTYSHVPWTTAWFLICGGSSTSTVPAGLVSRLAVTVSVRLRHAM